VIKRVFSKEPCLLFVWVLEVALNINMCILFLENDLKQLHQCKDQTIMWKEGYFLPFVELDNLNALGVEELLDKKPIK